MARSEPRTESSRPGEPDPAPPRCGLCGATERLTRTECCGNWICDDEGDYQLFSYARNSCSRNHRRYTLCGGHHAEGHSGRWQDCATCREDQEPEFYAAYGTNEYNFERLANPPKFAPTFCARCHRVIRLAEEGWMMSGKKRYCERCMDKVR